MVLLWALLFLAGIDMSDVAMVEESPVIGEDEAFKEFWLDKEIKEPLPQCKSGGWTGENNSAGPLQTFHDNTGQVLPSWGVKRSKQSLPAPSLSDPPTSNK